MTQYRCPKCGAFTITVTLGGFLTITRCDACQWWTVSK